MATAREVLQLYRQMLRVGKSFSSYNYRMYATRRIKDAFKENKNITDPEKIKSLIMKAQDTQSFCLRLVHNRCSLSCPLEEELKIMLDQPSYVTGAMAYRKV
ncbi:LYR motif-containing protein 4 [Acropora cervicornis]|uniref:LYR motif-containing protein 4 n=1 Tax=Acropora cervicornis TaxID=6130 RepID=A0AAD9QEC9_ACRCE|nr:LYR motif-containing protein 4 [Acropora cervicornis]